MTGWVQTSLLCSARATTTNDTQARTPDRFWRMKSKTVAQYELSCGSCELVTEQRVVSSAELQDLTYMSGTCAKKQAYAHQNKQHTPQGKRSTARLHFMQLKTRAVRKKHTGSLLCSFAALLALATPLGLLPVAALGVMRM